MFKLKIPASLISELDIDNDTAPAEATLTPPAPTAALPYSAVVKATLYNGALRLQFAASVLDGSVLPWASADIREFSFSAADFEQVKAELSAYVNADGSPRVFAFASLRLYADWIIGLLQKFTDLTTLQYKAA